MKQMKQHIQKFALLMLLLLVEGFANEAWAAKVTYHVLTLPFTTKNDDGSNYKTNIRVEAIRVIVDNGTQVELPAHFKSPLAKNFAYYDANVVTQSANPEQIYPNNSTKAYTYTVSGSPMTPGSSITTDKHIYVTYEYDTSNTIAKLDGTKTYNIYIRGGFLAYNRGRNNRPAVVLEKYITAGMLANEDFVKVDVSDGKSGITTYWNDPGSNKNKKTEVESQFNFLFTYEGSDPYNITIRSKYNNATACFIEKNIEDSKFVNKYYKGASLFTHQNDNIFLSSDDHIRYTYLNQNTSVKNVTSEAKNGYFHGLSNPIWSSFAFLNNTTSTGYVFLATNTVDNKGFISDPTKSGNAYVYNYLTNTNNNNGSYNNNLSIKAMTSEAANNYSTAKDMYEIKDINFVVTTPFGNTVSASTKISQFFIDKKQLAIDVSDIPDELRRKYCNFKTKFYSDAAHENEITKYSQATSDGGATYNVYVDYEVSATTPFKAIKPSDSYTSATWYELTDGGSTQDYGRKIKWNSTVFKNNGANGEFKKESEFAFVGDPYELRVLYRDATETAKANRYVGGSTTLGVSSSDYVSNNASLVYGTNYTFETENLATGTKTITFTISGLKGDKKIKVTKGGTDGEAQVASTSPTLNTVTDETSATETVTVTLNANNGVAKTMTITVQEYETDGTTKIGDPTVITINQSINGYLWGWEIPTDAESGSFLLQKFNDVGHWNWTVGQKSQDVAYTTKVHACSTDKDAQTITFNITGLAGNKYFKITTGGSDAGQIESITPSVGYVVAETGTSATVIVKLKANTGVSDKTMTVTIQQYDDNEGVKPSESPAVITITQGTTSSHSGNTVEYSTTNSTYVKVLELPKRTFTYKIIDKSGRIAAKASIDQTIFSPLKSYANLPSIIISPFIVDETLTFYKAYSGPRRTNLSDANIITETPDENHDIFVKYTTTHLDNKPIKLSEDQEFNVKLNGKYIYYNSSDGKIYSADEVPTDESQKKYYLWKLRNRDPYAMLIDNMGARECLPNVENKVAGQSESVTIYDDNGTGTSQTRQKGAWVKLATGDLGNAHELVFTTNRGEAQQFIAKSSLQGGIYEVMLAVGDVDAGGETPTYYNIGRPADNTVKIYNNNTGSGGYAHGNNVLAFVLNQTTVYTYHLIDKAKHKLLEIETKSPDLILPSEYQSPLVDKYSYYASDDITETTKGGVVEYEPKENAAEITNLLAVYTKTSGSYSSQWSSAGEGYKHTANDEAELDDKAKELPKTGDHYFQVGTSGSYTYYFVNVTKPFHGQIYVTYTKNDLVKFNDTGSPYLLKFLDPYAEGYNLEDGNDKLTTEKIQAVYPYTNGDGNLNIYGQPMNEEQMNGGSSTRPRWVWFFNSDNDDPYHVTIHSKSTISYNGVSHPTYLQTYAVHFNQDISSDTKHIVTGGALPGIASTKPTEYMILGTVDEDGTGHYKLLTTNPINETVVDGVADKDKRQYVTSFEQYWKTYNMIKLHVLGIPKSTDAFSNEESTWVVPDTPLETTYDANSLYKKYNDTYDPDLNYRDFLYQQMHWHSYDAIANATRWNGYNDKSDGAEKKVVEKLEHWAQTFDMGDGTFDIISADIPPVLVLLDRHGWEIMRKPLPTTTYPYGDDELKALKAYDSPMVESYHFYSNATKASGCHKYTLRTQNGALRDEIKDNGVAYTSKSLALLPPASATGVKSGDAFNDQFVTYTVKEEYEKSYQYNLELHEEDSTYTESGTASKFLILQNGRYMRDNSDKYSEKPSYLTKPIFEHTSPAGGNVYDMILLPVNSSTVNIDKNNDGTIDDENLWYVQPNLNIDKEMGIKWAKAAGGSAEPLTEYETKKAYKDKTGFDPYNIQLKNADGSKNKYLTTHINTTSLSGGSMVGDYTDGSINVTLEAWVDVKDADTSTPKEIGGKTVDEGYDHTNIQMTNQTFMAVADDDGNIQLMPRFDHNKRVDVDGDSPWNSTLEDPKPNNKVASADDNSSMGPQTVLMVRPQVFEYHIIDHEGNEALGYKTTGEYSPSVTEHFRSPLATDYKFYFSHAAQTTTESSEASYNAIDPSSASSYFKKEVASVSEMETTAKAFTVLDDYFFRIGAGTEESPYTYKKVTVTKGYVSGSPAKDATYTTTNCTEEEWTNAVAYKEAIVASESAMKTKIEELTNTGFHYYKIGPTTLYRKVTVTNDGKTQKAVESSESAWSSHDGGTQVPEVSGISAYKTAIDALSSNGIYYYKITNYYSYKKVVVVSVNRDFGRDVADGNDISSKEITGTFADAGLNGENNQVYVRYSYHEDADIDQNKILQGKWFTIKLADKDVQASGSFVFHKTVADELEYNAAFDALSSDGEYYFRYGTSPYTYKKVTVTSSGSSKIPETIDVSIWTTTLGTGVSLYKGTDKPTPTVGADGKKWQWKFLAAPVDPESPYYIPVDPYAVQLYNRQANYTTDLNLDPNPMSVGIKVNGKDRFAILTHPSGGYAFAVQGGGKSTSYAYTFLNGASMDVPSTTAATTVAESNDESAASHFTIKSSALSAGSQIILNDDVTHTYTYNVINNVASGSKIAVNTTQGNDEAKSHNYAPHIPENIQSPLLNLTDYSYYGNATVSSGAYTVVNDTKLHTLYGLYDDVVYVRYGDYDVNQTKYKVPNKRNATGTGQVAKDASSKDASLNIDGRLPYNIIWYNDNMMQSTDNTTISDGVSKALSGDANYAWQFEGGDPYALKIKHKASGKYINNSSCTLEDTATPFMLLKKDGYDYGVLQVTEGTNMLSGYGNTLVASSPTKFIIFGLSVTDLIYHMVLATTNTTVNIPWRDGDEDTWKDKKDKGETWAWTASDVTPITGSTQRDLTSENTGEGPHYAGEKYQLGETISGLTYCHDAGSISIGDVLKVPTVFYRPNCSFDFYIDGVYDSYNTGTKTLGTENTILNNRYKGLKLDEAAPRLMSDADLINKVVRVNIVYSFDKDVATNTGLDFVRNVSDNFWYTYETYDESTPYLAHYTNAWGLQSMEGRETRYTNDYLWTPLGDPYGFRMYNRYMVKSSTRGDEYVMTTSSVEAGKKLFMAIPGETDKPTGDGEGKVPEGNEVYELLTGDADGYFRIHPIINKSETPLYVIRDSGDSNYTKLSTTPCDWRFGLDMTLLEPYYERAGYLGGLTTTAKDPSKEPKSGKKLYEEALKENIMEIQRVVYDDNNIVDYTDGYYRLHSVPGTLDIDSVRYASGYLHKTELNPDGNDGTDDAIPMHFYSKKGVSTTFGSSGLKKGYKETAATRGEIPVPATEYDPSTIFYLKGGVDPSDALDRANPRVKMSTQGLYVKGIVPKIIVDAKEVDDPNHGDAVMTATEGDATKFSLIGIGGAVFLITDKLDPPTRNYLHYGQDYTVGGDNKIYDLKYYHNSPTNEARWCIEPANNQGLMVETNDANDGYYYTTFCAPYDVLLPTDDKGVLKYDAYTCDVWNASGLTPKKVPEVTDKYSAGRFVPAGTPVIIRTNDESGKIKLSLPSEEAITPAISCVFSGKYLEQLLDVDASHDVYTLGLPFTSDVKKDKTPEIPGDIDAPVIEQATSGVGFYINATPNKEVDPLQSLWIRNNRYVLHNKIYYRYNNKDTNDPVGAPQMSPEFVPVIFDDEEDSEELTPNGTREIVGDGCIYDLMGRKVATREQVEDGSWKQRVATGIYILNGKKFQKK